MAYRKPLPVDEEQAVRQAGLPALTAQMIAMQDPTDQPETQQYWMTRAMAAYRRVPDRSQQILGTGLAIEAFHLQRGHDLQTASGDEMLGKSLLIPTCLARGAVDHGWGRRVVNALQAVCSAAPSVSVNAALVGSRGVHD